MTKLSVLIDDGATEPRPVDLPAHYEVCPRCSGEGKSSAHLGSFSREDKGARVVAEIDRDACTTDEQKAALSFLDDQAEYRRESFRERRAESLMCGGSLRDWEGVYAD